MSKFNFNEILLSAKANISKIMENFTKVEDNALASSDIVDNLITDDATKVLSAKQGKKLNDNFDNYKSKDNFAVMSINIPMSNAKQVIEQVLPEGFTPTNSVVISVVGCIGNSYREYYYPAGGSEAFPITEYVVYHKNSTNKDVIELTVWFSQDIRDLWGHDVDIEHNPLIAKIVLMKIS